MMGKSALTGLLACVSLLLSASFGWTADDEKEPREGGILGTGIVGTITQLGSIIVNGQRITFDDTDMATSIMGARRAAALTPGDTVAVVAQKTGRDWQADSIRVHYAAIAPVVWKNDTLHVLGSPVDLSDAVAGTRNTAATLTNGDWIAVNGLWKGTTLMASKITPVRAQKMATISGSYMTTAGGKSFVIGGSVVNGLDLLHVASGDVVTVSGQARDGGIMAEMVAIGLFAAPVQNMIAEGYLSRPSADGYYTVLGSGAVSFTENPAMIDPKNRGVYCISIKQDQRRASITPARAQGPITCR